MKSEQPLIVKTSLRNKLAFVLIITSYFFFFPGIYLSMLSISSSGAITAKVPHVEHGFLNIPRVEGTETKHIGLEFFDTTRSILNTVHDLWIRDYNFVSIMIFLFSIIIPILKGLLLTYNFFSRQPEIRKKIFAFVQSISKWSMCDVFIVAILLAYLSTGSTTTQNTKNVSVMGYNLHVNVLFGMEAKLQTGFWCFLAYCLLSLTALQLYKSE
jgi:paraquat-inducible protein A